VSPSLTVSVTRGICAASSAWASERAPVACTTCLSAPVWSACWCVVTTADSPAGPIRSSSVSASFAASISTCEPSDRHFSRYALLSIGPTDTFVTVRPFSSRTAGAPPRVTSPV
jgi:hypothetical protein